MKEMYLPELSERYQEIAAKLQQIMISYPGFQANDTSGADWQEEVYQKIKVMKGTYLPVQSEMYHSLVSKLQEQESLPPPLDQDKLEKLKMFKTILERLITVLQLSKSSISPDLKEKLSSYEKQMAYFVNTKRPRKPVSSLHLPPSGMHFHHGMHGAHLVQLPKVEKQTSNLVTTEGQRCQPHPSHEICPQKIQSQLGHMQHHQFNLQQQSNPVQLYTQERPQASCRVFGVILQPPNTTELQNQLYQSHGSLQETSSSCPAQTGHTDWQEEAYQKGRREATSA